MRIQIESLENRQLLSTTAPWGYFAQMLGQDKLASAYPQLTGAGQTVVLIDSGADYKNPVLGGGFGPGYKVAGGWDFVGNDADPYLGDDNVHATGVLGVLAANGYVYNGKYNQGIAPGVRVLLLRQNSSAECKQALDWVIANRSQYNISVVNLTDFYNDWMNPKLYASELATLDKAGVFIASPAGNLGSSVPLSVTSAAVDPNVYGTTAIGKTGALPDFAQRDINVDALGPGQNVTLPYYDPATHKAFFTDYGTGTSWSTPVLTGTAILLKQINPNFTPDQIMSIVRDSGVATYDPVSGLTYPRMDVYAAVKLAYARMNGTGSSTPFSGTAVTAPGLIQAENYDNGGDGFAYHDLEAANQGGKYRANGVDLCATTDSGGGYALGWAQAGEWVNYTINVTTAGDYSLSTRWANTAAGGTFHISVDGTNVSGAQSVANTGSWDTWATLSDGNVHLTAGQHVLRVSFDAASANGFCGNLNWIRVDVTSTDPTPPPVAQTIRVEAENYNAGGEGVGYHDSDRSNSGGKYRSDGVDINTTGDTGGGYVVGWTYAGEWMNYTVNVAATADYTITSRWTNPGDGGKFHILVDGVNATGTQAVPNTGAWDSNYQTLTDGTVHLTAGSHLLRLVFDTNSSDGFVGNVNWIALVPVSTTPTRTLSLGGSLAFGEVAVGASAQKSLTIYNTGNSILTVNGISCPAGFSGNWSGTIAAGGSQVVSVTFSPTAETTYGGAVTVDSDETNSGGNTATASGTGAVAPAPTRVLSLGGSLAFGNVAIGSSAQKSLTIYNTGNSILTVNGISCPAGFSGNWSGTIAAGGSQLVTVVFSPTAETTYGGAVTVDSDETNDGGNTVTASGTGAVAPAATRIIAVGGSLAFGNVAIGSSAQKSLTIYNTGNSVLTVSGISCPAGFSGNWSGTIAAGGSQLVTVVFSPTAAASYSGTVTVNSDETNSGGNTIAASGLGTVAAPVAQNIRLEAENYNTGGEGVAYHDTTAGNSGGAYRKDGVDIGSSSDTGGGYNVGWIAPGEWLKYTFNVAATGTYDLTTRWANASTVGGGRFHVEINGVAVNGREWIPGTGSWSKWTTVDGGKLTLTKGTCTLKIVFESAGSDGSVGNLNWINLAPVA